MSRSVGIFVPTPTSEPWQAFKGPRGATAHLTAVRWLSATRNTCSPHSGKVAPTERNIQPGLADEREPVRISAQRGACSGVHQQQPRSASDSSTGRRQGMPHQSPQDGSSDHGGHGSRRYTSGPPSSRSSHSAPRQLLQDAYNEPGEW